MGKVEEALTISYTLPIPVGLSPQDLTLGASGVVTLNDYSRVVGVIGSGQYGNVASLGSTGTTSLGVNAVVRNVWSRPNVDLRQTNLLGYFKTQGTYSKQAGTQMAEPEENRTGVTIRQDPIWTVTLSAPSSGTTVTVDTGVTALAPGNYGNVTLNGGTLQLSSGVYGFASLTINSGAVVQMPAAGLQPPRLFVNSSLVLRGHLVRTGLILAYLGTNPVSMEATFSGDLFLAPNADLSIKSDVIGHFFAKTVTVFEGRTAYTSVLSQETQDFVRPTETVQSGGGTGLFSGTTPEIVTALLTPQLNSACSAPRAFVSYSGNGLLYKNVTDIGTSTVATAVSFTPPVAPSACLANGFTPAITPVWSIVAGGTPSYRDSPTIQDSMLTRLSNGRVAQIGLGGRWCLDSSSGLSLHAGCPASLPAAGTSCDPALLANQACVYGATQCQCLPDCGAAKLYGVGGLEGTSCSDGTAHCCSGVCTSSGTPGVCTAPSPLPATTWTCGNLDRVEEGTAHIRLSTNCGSSWTSGVFDPALLGIKTAGGGLARVFDRHETFWDNFDDRLYVSVGSYAGGGIFTPAGQNALFSAVTAGVANAGNLTWQQVLPEEPANYRVMTSVLEERARFNTVPASFSRHVHLVTVRCASRPEIQFYTPFGVRTWDVTEGSTDPSTVCDSVRQGDVGQPFGGLQAGPTVAAISSEPPRVVMAYTGRAGTGSALHTIINVYLVTLKSAGGYTAPPAIVRLPPIDVPGRHSVYPDFIEVDGLAGSDRQVDSPVVLRWSEIAGDAVTEKAKVLYSGLAGPPLTIKTWSVAATFPTVDCLSPSSGCFVGDYKYGAFYRKSNGTLTFFTPWTGGGTDPATGTPIPYVATSGGFVDVTP